MRTKDIVSAILVFKDGRIVDAVSDFLEELFLAVVVSSLLSLPEELHPVRASTPAMPAHNNML